MLLLIAVTALLVVQNRRVQQGEQRFFTLFEYSPAPMWIIVNGHFIDCNLAAMRILGVLDKSTVLGISPVDISPERQSDGEYSRIKAERFFKAVAGFSALRGHSLLLERCAEVSAETGRRSFDAGGEPPHPRYWYRCRNGHPKPAWRSVFATALRQAVARIVIAKRTP